MDYQDFLKRIIILPHPIPLQLMMPSSNSGSPSVPFLHDSSKQGIFSTIWETTQTPIQHEETLKLKDIIASLQSKLENYKAQLVQYQELCSYYAHRNKILETELAILKEHLQHQEFHKLPKPAPVPHQITVKSKIKAVPNTSSISKLQKTDVSSPTTARPSAKIAPLPQSRSPPKQLGNMQTLASTRSTREPSGTEVNPASTDIVIFSNSIFKKIDNHIFMRGKSTKVFTIYEASIMDIQTMVKDCKYDQPKYVILQAWIYSVKPESRETFCKQAESLINTTLDKFPQSQIIISGMIPQLIPVSQSNAMNGLILDRNDILQQCCCNNPRLTFVNQAQSFVTADGYIRSNLYLDKVHLKSEGLEIMTKNFRNVISSSEHFQ